LFWSQKTHFRAGRHENKEKRLFYFGLRILLAAIQIQLLDIENPKNPNCPYTVYRESVLYDPVETYLVLFI
jgi:hypothetical protein